MCRRIRRQMPPALHGIVQCQCCRYMLSQIPVSLGMLRVAQAAQVCTATSSGSLSHCSVLNLVCSSSKAQIEYGKVSFPQEYGGINI
jgi:hypothetical protein